MRHHRSTTPFLSLATLTLLLGAAGCPGDLRQPVSTELQADGAAPIWSTPGSDGGAPQGYDSGSTAQQDGAGSADSVPAPDTTAPQPDTTAPQPDATAPAGNVGQPCPCSGGAVCISGVCRATCNAPTDGCKVSSNCPTDHACLVTTKGFHVCVPAGAKPGQPCSKTQWCPINHVCGKVGTAPYLCLPTCTIKNAACGTGGTCLPAGGGCMFCSKP